MDEWIDRLMSIIIPLTLVAGVAFLIVITIWILKPKPTPFEQFQAAIEECIALIGGSSGK